MTDADVEQALRTVRPVKVVAVLEDDRELAIAIPRGTRKWERMANTIASQSWVEIRMLDKVGGLMAAPLLREGRAAPTALEDLNPPPTSSEVLVPAGVVSTLLRATIQDVARGFVEVVKATRQSGSAEVTAALTANRETIGALHAVIADVRDDLAAANDKVRELEDELAARLADEVKRAGEVTKESAGERFLGKMLDGAIAGAGDASKANGNGKAAE